MDNDYHQLEKNIRIWINESVECYELYEGIYDSLYDKINEEKK